MEVDDRHDPPGEERSQLPPEVVRKGVMDTDTHHQNLPVVADICRDTEKLNEGGTVAAGQNGEVVKPTDLNTCSNHVLSIEKEIAEEKRGKNKKPILLIWKLVCIWCMHVFMIVSISSVFLHK